MVPMVSAGTRLFHGPTIVLLLYQTLEREYLCVIYMQLILHCFFFCMLSWQNMRNSNPPTGSSIHPWAYPSFIQAGWQSTHLMWNPQLIVKSKKNMEKLASHSTSPPTGVFYRHFPTWNHMLRKENTTVAWQNLGNQSTMWLVNIRHPHLNSIHATKRKLAYVSTSQLTKVCPLIPQKSVGESASSW